MTRHNQHDTEPMVTKCFRLPQVQIAWLEQVAGEEGRREAEIVRELIAREMRARKLEAR